MSKATLTTEINVETPNTVGIAAKVSELVARQAKANIRSAFALGTNGQGHFTLLTDANQKVMEALKGEFPKIKEREVLVLNVADHIGELDQITTKLGQANINIDYFYTTYLDNKPAVVLSTNNNKKAFDLFN